MDRHLLRVCLFASIGLGACGPNGEQNDAASGAASIECNQLNGKKYSIALSTGGKVEAAEIFTFHEQLAESSGCVEYGFCAAPYLCSAGTQGVLHFQTVMLNPTEGQLDWDGTVSADRIRGSVRWAKAGQADVLYTFEGPAQ